MHTYKITVHHIFILIQQLSTEGDFALRGHLAMSRDSFGFHSWRLGAGMCYRHLVGKHSAMHKTALQHQRIILVQNVKPH